MSKPRFMLARKRTGSPTSDWQSLVVTDCTGSRAADRVYTGCC
jgi:hypothetical protein